MSDLLRGFFAKLKDKLASSKAWATVGGNVIGLEAIHGDWQRAAVVVAVNVAYLASEVAEKWLAAKYPQKAA